MTPKEKAFELVDKIYQWFPLEYYVIKQDLDVIIEYNGWGNAKQCALIAVDEILNTIMSVYQPETKLYWIEVKKEIEKL
jgi:hypothetical protein